MRNIGLPGTPLDPEIVMLAQQYGHRREALLEMFRTLQVTHGGLTEKMVSDVARVLHISPAQAFGVASFYAMLSTHSGPPHTIRLCDSPPCWLRGAAHFRTAVEATSGVAWTVTRTSCLGLCDRAPAALVDEQQCGPLTPERVPEVWQGWRGAAPTYGQPLPGEVRVLLAHVGDIDPHSLDAALAHGAYQGLQKALEQSPEDVLGTVEASGVRGRGGAGFPVGQKWRAVAQQQCLPKYMVCNADESEPLVFKDRVLMETKPHQILEGMAIAGYVTGAQEGYIYIRGEYAPQAAVLAHAIHQAEAQGYLGERLLGTAFSFRIHLHRGAGAYICGEETALLESLQGKRGEPRVRPPYPTTSGYWGSPTVVNNVETLAVIPAIVTHGAAWYRALGHPATPGTKLYTVLGHINRPGLFEAPYGLTLRHVIEHFGDGMLPGSTFHFALTGGAAGTLVPATLPDVPIDYASAAQGVMLGAGAFLICDQSVSPVMLLRELMHFFAVESCGKCTPCRIGTLQAHQILERMGTGAGQPGDVAALTALAEVLEKASFCGLGQSAAWPISSALRHFGAVFAAQSGAGEGPQ
jgi:NADH:ubiquinone oxidoreductase subunit F (NADH-binding)/NADH:ubiquinone oxidoreductase subunit E